jgi:uncharacterized delta-60 repeat protein
MGLTTHNKPEDTMNSNSTRLSTRPKVGPANPRAIPRARRRPPGPVSRALAWLAGGLLLVGAGSAPAAAEGPADTDPAPRLPRPDLLEDQDFTLHEVFQLNTRPSGFYGTRSLPRPGEIPAARGRAGVRLHADSLPPADTQPEPTVVDVMFLYTPQAVIGEGSEEGLRRRVLKAVENFNFYLTNSRVHVHIHPVFIGLINYAESGSLDQDMTRLVNGIEGLERARLLRNDYKADLVCLIPEQGGDYWAWELTIPESSPATGFFAVRRVLLTMPRESESSNLAHALGHLLGVDNDREHAALGNPEHPYYRARQPYIWGHRFEVEGVQYRDIMSYGPGITLPYFSNPRLDLDGVPLGVSAEELFPSDGARTINEIAPYVARYRTARSRIEFTSSRLFGQERPGQESRVVVGLRRTGDLDTSTRVNVTFDPASPAKAGLDYLRPASTWVTFETNQAAAELSFEILADDLVEGEETLRLRLATPEGDHGLGAQSVCEVSIRDADVPLEFAQLEFPDGPLTMQETAGEARVRVRYPHPYPPPDVQPPLTVPYRTADGTAVAGQDYQAVAGTLALAHANAATEWEISVPLLFRSEPGPDRSFTLIVGTHTNTVRILDAQHPGAVVGTPGENLNLEGVVFGALARGDGRLLVWGNFSFPGAEARHGLALLTRDGAVDPTFRPPELWPGHRSFEELGRYAPHPFITSVKLQPDGKLVLAGNFSRVNGQPRNSLLRLHPDGSVDESFGRELRFDGLVWDLVTQPDGRIVVGGEFRHINDQPRPYIARLLPDGTPDDSFQPNGGPTSSSTVTIVTLDLQPDGRILMGGFFEQVDGQPMRNLARLNPDGTFDPTFQLRDGASGVVHRIRQQPDGRIVVSGVFDTLGGRSFPRLGRLLADGTPDPDFRMPRPNAEVWNIVCLPDGRLLISGWFTTIAGQNRRSLAVLQADGTLDPTVDFGTGVEGFPGPWGTPVFADGSVYLVGQFQKFNGLPAASMARLRLGELAPRLAAPRLAEGQMIVPVQGLPGGTYAVEASTDLEHWEPVGQVRLEGYETTGTVRVPATGAAGFFRSRRVE